MRARSIISARRLQVAGKYTTRKIYSKLYLGLKWRILHILASENINDFSDIMLDP